VSADHSASLVSTLAEVIDAEIWRNRGNYDLVAHLGIDDDPPGESLDQHPSALPAAQAFIDGPLSDLSMLVQIPEVRELVLELWCAYHGDTSGRKTMQPWFDALEVTS